jgi:hypothetical protein
MNYEKYSCVLLRLPTPLLMEMMILKAIKPPTSVDNTNAQGWMYNR